MFAFSQTRLPRFRRASADIGAMHLTARDLEIVRNVARHRFLRSTHIVSLLDESPQQVLRRLQLLFHHGYLDRPRAQLSYFHEGGSQAIVYGLGNRGAEALVAAEELERQKVDWTAKNREAKGLYIGHTLAVAEVMVAMELACRATGRIRLLREEELAGRIKLADPFRWTVQVQGNRLGIVPDRVFGFEDVAQGSRCFYFLEADRATMPAVRSKLSQSSFYRKLVAYEATWAQEIHKRRLGFHRFRVLTVTTTPRRVEHLAAVCRSLPRGQGLFLFTDRRSLLASEPFLHTWTTAQPGETAHLL